MIDNNLWLLQSLAVTIGLTGVTVARVGNLGSGREDHVATDKDSENVMTRDGVI